MEYRMKRVLKRMAKTSLLAIALLLLAGCLVVAEFFFGIAPSGESNSRVAITLPELNGPYPVARRFFDWIDYTRSDPFHKSAKREVVVSVWYPAQATAANQTATYLPGNRGLAMARFQSMMMRVRVQSFWSALLHNPLPRDFLAGMRTHALENLGVAGTEPRFPVLLFLPGFGAMETEYTAILEDVASHGYVVVAINPTDFAPATVFENGRTTYAPVWNTSFYDIEKDYPIWVQDMLFALNEVSRENKDPNSPFFDRLDMTKVGAFGHSFGGAASAGACHFDPRIGAGLNLDGAPHGNPSTWKFPQPFMLVQSGKKAYRDRADEEFLRSLIVGYRAVIKGSTHHAFTDEVILPLPENRREALVGSIPGPRMVRMTSLLVCAFFDIHLRKKPSGLLKDVSLEFPEITIQTSSGSEADRRAQ
jgi:pimeloyl-ACP methyl ester carboxylesterase